MIRKTEFILSNEFNRLREFRGIPINHKLTDKTPCWVYGLPRVIDEYRIRVQYDPKNPIPRKAYMIFYNEQYNGMSMYSDIEIHLNSLGQKICSGVFEGDLLEHEDFKGCLFEPIWCESQARWKIKLVYGSNGQEFDEFPDNISEYSTDIHLWSGNQSWYPTIIPRYNPNHYRELDDSAIFIGTSEYNDLWFNSKRGNNGEVWVVSPFLETKTITDENGDKKQVIKPNTKEMNIKVLGDAGTLSITYPDVWEQFLKRKLIKL